MAATPPPNTRQKPTGGAPAPAYATAPRRSGLLFALAGIVALAALAAMAIYMFGGQAPTPAGSATEPRSSDGRPTLDAAKAALDEASKSVLKPAPSSPPSGDPVTESPPMTAAAPPQGSPAAAAPRAEPSPAAAVPPRIDAAGETSRAAPRRAAPAPAPPRASSPPPAAATAPPQPPPPAAAPAPAPAPAQVASAERFAQMRDEMARCSTTSLIPRIQCEQRIRARYCDGYWGSVPECPTGRSRG